MSDAYPVLYGADGVPCAQCGSPLAGDQRYCMVCGTRRAEAPGPFPPDRSDTYLVPYGQAPAGPVAAAVPVLAAGTPTLSDQLRRNGAVIGLAGVLLLSMLIGVLLGHWAGEDDATAQAPPPQVISIGGAAAAPASPSAPVATTPEAPAGAGEDAEARDEGGDSGSSSSGSAAGEAEEAAAPEAPPPPKELGRLDGLTGKDRQKAVDALPKAVSTGGKAPPKDDKAPAAGGEFEEIG